METTHKILVVGRHADILEKVINYLNQNGYEAIGETENTKAILTFSKNKIEAVVIGGGVDNQSRMQLSKEFKKLNPEIKIIDAHPSTVLRDLKEVF